MSGSAGRPNVLARRISIAEIGSRDALPFVRMMAGSRRIKYASPRRDYCIGKPQAQDGYAGRNKTLVKISQPIMIGDGIHVEDK